MRTFSITSTGRLVALAAAVVLSVPAAVLAAAPASAAGLQQVSGRFVTAGGDPVTYCGVHLSDAKDEVSAWVYTSEAGTVSAGLPAGSYSLSADCRITDGYVHYSRSVTVAGAPVDLGDVVPTPGTAVSGTVRDAGGAVVAGGWVAAYEVGSEYVDGVSGYSYAKVDASGRYTLGLAPGTWTLGFNPPSGRTDVAYTERAGVVVGGSPLTGVDETLPVPGTLTGSVTSGGQPVATGYVSATNSVTGFSQIGAIVNGAVQIGRLAPGHYVLSAYAEGHEGVRADQEVDVVSGANPSFALVVPEAVALSGRVALASGALIPDLEVDAPGVDTSSHDWARTNSSFGFSLSSVGAGSKYTVEVNRYSGESLYTGRYYAGAGKLGSATRAGASVVIPSSASPDLGTMVLDTCGTVRGRVVGPGGLYMGGFPAADNSMSVAVYNDSDQDLVTRSATVAPDGTFAVTGLLPGSYYAALRITQGADASAGAGWTSRVVEIPFAGVSQSSGSPNVVVSSSCGEVQGVNFNVPAATANPDEVLGVTPVRLADYSSVAGFGPAQCVSVVGAGAPSGASGVLANVASVNPGSEGNAVLFPSDGNEHPTPPNAVSVNFEQGQTVANAAFVQVGSDGKVCAYAQAFSGSRLVLDVSGFSMPSSGMTLQAAQRLVDTRSAGTAAGVTGGLAPRHVYEVQVSGSAGVPSGATAVVLNVAAVTPAGVGNLRLFPATGTQTAPDIATLNYAPGRTKSNAAVVPLSADGKLGLYSDTFSAAPVQVVLDVTGYVVSGSTYQTVSPTRVLDTRPTAPAAVHQASTLTANTPVAFNIRGTDVVPDNATGVLMNVTAIGPNTPGNLKVYPDTDGTGATSPPDASQINYIVGRDIPNLVLAKVPADGKVMLYSNQFAGGSVNVAIDVVGYTTAPVG